MGVLDNHRHRSLHESFPLLQNVNPHYRYFFPAIQTRSPKQAKQRTAKQRWLLRTRGKERDTTGDTKEAKPPFVATHGNSATKEKQAMQRSARENRGPQQEKPKKAVNNI
jgi:hypothetical protein